ncbi:hypothetical protein PMH09_15400 [Roseofilum sp. BLCC_M143]|uniref:HEAT repeat domain-containing protein n=2 Tax=Roseofilum TaxID=1233426 RepID=A0ABT7BZE4_9CYAN|nr:hypothetical protein [Roseofilum casamattae BLCC-M143]
MKINLTLQGRFAGALWGLAIASALAQEDTPLREYALAVEGGRQLIDGGTLNVRKLSVAQPQESIALLLLLSLYYHEDPQLFSDRWEEISAYYQYSPDWEIAGRVIALTVGLLLEGKSDPKRLIEGLRSQLQYRDTAESPSLNSALNYLCENPRAVFQQQELSEKVSRALQPVVLGLACFLASSHSFSGVISLAKNYTHHRDCILAIAAILVGVDRTQGAIAVPWQLWLQHQIAGNSQVLVDPGDLAIGLLSSWSGAHLPQFDRSNPKISQSYVLQSRSRHAKIV